MQCPREYEWERYVDGESPPSRQEELKSHLVGCPECGRLVAHLRREGALISAALAATPLPPDLSAIIKQRFVSTSKNGGRWLWFFLPMLSLAAAFVALDAGWWPLFEKMRAIVNLLGGGDLLFQFVLFSGGLMEGLADAAMRGKSVMPALTVLVSCVLWMQLKIRIGGRAHV